MTETMIFTVEGMGCAACQKRIETAVRALDGVVSADVSLEQKRLTVCADPAKVTAQQILDTVDDTGFDAALV